MRTNRLCAYIALASAALQAALVLVSWIVAAAFPERDIHSLLGSEGIRWLVGHFVDNLVSPLLVWILLLAVSLGAFRSSGLCAALRSLPASDYRQRMALRLVLAELCAFVCVVLLLTAVPHAVLLNVTGHLFPSSFSAGLIPLLALAVCVFSATYSVSTGQTRKVHDIFKLFTSGVETAAPLLVAYILAVELYYSTRYVFVF